MGAFALTASLLGRFIVVVVVGVCTLVAMLIAGGQALAAVDRDPPEYAGYDLDENGGWTPAHGPRGDCWACENGSAGDCWYCLPDDVRAQRLMEGL